MQSNFISFDYDRANKLANQFGTPLFIIDEQGLLDRYRSIQHATTKRYTNSIIALSYKTNFIKGILGLLHREGAHAEVVSGIEYELATKIKNNDQKIIFNGPMKTERELSIAIDDGAIINCDHLDEIERIEALAKIKQHRVPIGLRIYFSDNSSVWNRFGFAVQSSHIELETKELIQRLQASPHIRLAGLHTHIGTNIRDISQFSMLGHKLNSFSFLLKDEFNIELDWIDVGGGLAGITPTINELMNQPHLLPNIDDYADAIITPLLPYLNSLQIRPLLFFEPGRTLFEPYGALLTRIVGRRPIDEQTTRAYICDAGINALATSYHYDFPIHTLTKNKNDLCFLSRLLGPTCNQKDQLHSPVTLPELDVNDLLLFYGVGSYCMAFSYSFIRFRPPVVLWRGDNRFEWLRRPETLENTLTLQDMPLITNTQRAYEE